MKLSLNSPLGKKMQEMLIFRETAGLSTESYCAYFKSLDQYCCANYPAEPSLTKDIVLGWLKTSPGTVNVLHHRASAIRMLGKYICSIGETAYVLPEKFVKVQQQYVPYILSDQEMSALFGIIDAYPPNPRLDALQPALFSTIFRLIYTCGLRPNEARTLLCHNINLVTGEIFIEESKKHKDRIVVMSNEMMDLAKRYAQLRDMVHPDSPYFFPSRSGVPYTAKMLEWHFKNFTSTLFPHLDKQQIPQIRIYDLRHRFATTVVQNWIDARRDLQNLLPYLSTYMGHAKLSYTAYYIQLMPEKLKKSQGIDWKTMGSIIPEVVLWEE